MLPRAPSAGTIMRQHENDWFWNPFPHISRPPLALLLYHVQGAFDEAGSYEVSALWQADKVEGQSEPSVLLRAMQHR